MNQTIDTAEKAYKMGSMVEKKVKEDKVAVAIFEGLERREWKWCFLQGHLETNGKVDKEDLQVVLVSRKPGLLQSMADFAEIPYRILEGRQLVYDDLNTIDFLGNVYKDRHIVDPLYYEKYLDMLMPVENCLVYRTCPEAILPSKTRMSDVGYDISIIRKVKDLTNLVALYDTGLKIRVPHGYYTEIVPRSSLSKSGYIMANSVGIIDRSYNGNLYVALAKVDESTEEIKFPFRCCQLVFRKQYHMMIRETKEDLEATARGEGGFGSTG